MGATAIIAGIGTAIAAAGTGYQIASSEDAKDKAAAAQKKNEANANDLLAQEKAQSAAQDQAIQAEADLNNRNSARNRQKALATGAYGRSDTILTGLDGSTLGAPAVAPTAQKTFLGA